ncbi:MAG TPA: DUF1992 domain-containing protein [Blastocatellia bacterium]|nr:DUF1992 domain-containing protein [Blastocatellia bacterium]
MLAFEKIAQNLIQEAMERGEFDNLSNKGQPLNLDEYFATPEEFRLGHSVLKNAKIVPAEIELLGEVGRLHEQIAACTDEAEKHQLTQRRNERQLQLRLLIERGKR